MNNSLPDPTNPIISLITDIPMSIVVVMLGWVVINMQNNRRESRKEIRSALNDVQELIKTAERDAIEFKTKSFDSKSKYDLIFIFRQISTRLQLVSKYLDVDLTPQITKFRRSVMERNWDSGDFVEVEKSDNSIKAIKLSSSKLSTEMEVVFFRSYHESTFRKVKNWWNSLD